MPFISKTPKPPYYAVVFTSINADVDHTEHREIYKRMVELAEATRAIWALSRREIPTGPESPSSIGRTMNRSWPLPETPNI